MSYWNVEVGDCNCLPVVRSVWELVLKGSGLWMGTFCDWRARLRYDEGHSLWVVLDEGWVGGMILSVS